MIGFKRLFNRLGQILAKVFNVCVCVCVCVQAVKNHIRKTGLIVEENGLTELTKALQVRCTRKGANLYYEIISTSQIVVINGKPS